MARLGARISLRSLGGNAAGPYRPDGKMNVMSGTGYFDYGDMKLHGLLRNREIGQLNLKAAVETEGEETSLKPKR